MTLTVGRVMSNFPYITDQSMSIVEAARYLEQANVRHLPVVDDGRLVGIVSERDLRQLEAFTDRANLTVADAMTRDPYQVSQSTPLLEVVHTMERNKYGSAIITKKGKVIGIFTTIDALTVLRHLLQNETEEHMLRERDIGSFFEMTVH